MRYLDSGINRFVAIFTALYAISILSFFGLYLSTGYALSSVLLGGFLAILPVPVWLLLSLLIDRKEPEPKWMLAAAFVWGSSIAAIFALIINNIFGNFLSENWIAMLIAPISEEICKGSLLFIFLLFIRKHINGVRDGIVYAVIIGLGFAMTENMVYYASSFQYSFSEGMGDFVNRGLLTPFLHPIFTSLTGIGIGIASKRDEGNKVAYEGLAWAVAAHALWNILAIYL